MDPISTIKYNALMKMKNIPSIALSLLATIALGAVFHFLEIVFVPLVFAGLLSLILIPLVNFLQKLRIPRFFCVSLVMVALFILLYVIARLFYSSLQTFTQVFGLYQLKLLEFTTEIWTRFQIPEDYFPQFFWTDDIMSRILQITSSFVSFGTSVFLVFLFLFFILTEYPFSRRKIRRILPHSIRIKISDAVHNSTLQITRYLTMKILISTATGFLVWLVLDLIGQDFSPLWGLLAFFLNFIPNVGSTFVMILTMGFALIQFYPTWGKIIAVWVTMPTIQIIMGNILDPQIQANRLDLSPLVILVALVTWGWIWGIAGMFLAVPLTVILKIIFSHIEGFHSLSLLMGSGKMSRSFRRSWRKRERTRAAKQER